MAVPRSGGYVLTLLYTKLKKTKQVCFLLAAILIRRTSQKEIGRARRKKKRLMHPNKKGGPRGGPPQRRLCFNFIIHQIEKKLNELLFLLTDSSYLRKSRKNTKDICGERKMLRRPKKKRGDRVAVPRSGGYVLTLLYTNLQKAKQSCFYISCNSYWKEHRKSK